MGHPALVFHPAECSGLDVGLGDGGFAHGFGGTGLLAHLQEWKNRLLLFAILLDHPVGRNGKVWPFFSSTAWGAGLHFWGRAPLATPLAKLDSAGGGQESDGEQENGAKQGEDAFEGDADDAEG